MPAERQFDGFQVFSGWMALLAGQIMLLAGAPAGWSFLVFAIGAALLASLWAIETHIALDETSMSDAVAAAVGLVGVALAVIYLTRSANDLPHLLPGRDGDSKRVLVAPGVTALLVGAVLVGRAVALSLLFRPRTE